MTDNICERCGKKFLSKSGLLSHLRRKNPCEAIIPEFDKLSITTEDPILIDSKGKNVLDLFCGAGLLSAGFAAAGFDIVAGVDIWDVAIKSFNNHHKNGICADLTKFPPEEFVKRIQTKIDVLIGGPSCQGFSIAGRRNKSDPRNSLFMEFVKYLDFFNPKAFVMENVIGILSMKNENNEDVISIIMSFLEKSYNCVICKLCASDFEVPQNRRRVIIIGIRKDLNIKPSPPSIISERISVGSILLPREVIDNSFFLSEKAIAGINAKKEKSKQKGNGFGAQFLDLTKPSFTIPARYWKDGYDALVKYGDAEIRRLTIEELRRIQTIPDNVKLEGSKKDQIIQIGNGVACRFAYHVAKHVINLLLL